MALDLTGIQNENDFYSHHYLSAILEGDLKEVFARWKLQEESYKEVIKEKEEKADASHPDRAPWIRVRTLGQGYLQIRNQLDHERSNQVRVELQRRFFADLLNALGMVQRTVFPKPKLRDFPETQELTQLMP